ncbi:hypothetical protein SSX86_030213, partial [Deinandra increscens subsp. villosa]
KLPNGCSLNSYFVRTVGNGSAISFWGDTWLRDTPLRLVYPNLFRLESDKWVMVGDRVKTVNGARIIQWGWKNDPTSQVEISELFQLLDDLFEFHGTVANDVWMWKEDANGVFSVRSAKELLYKSYNSIHLQTINWKVWVPLKCRIMVWRTIRDRLPTCVELAKRGVQLQSDSCIFCQSDQESSLHLFTACIYAHEVWNRLVDWCRLPPFFAFSVQDILQLGESHQVLPSQKTILRGIVYTAIWALWNERNARIFTRKFRRPVEVLESIKTTSFFWFRHRTRIKNIEWTNWCKYPLNSLYLSVVPG